jgi:hypothetical protein
MVLEDILTSFMVEIKEKFSELEVELKSSLDFTAIEQIISELLNSFSASLLEILLTKILSDSEFLAFLKRVCGGLGMGYKGHREITIRLYNGHVMKII